MFDAYHDSGVATNAETALDVGGDVLKLLQVFNWGVFGICGVSAVSWFAVCVMMWSYPRLIEQAGAEMEPVYTYTATFGALALVAAGATWLLRREHAWQWHGQAALALAVVGALAGWALF